MGVLDAIGSIGSALGGLAGVGLGIYGAVQAKKNDDRNFDLSMKTFRQNQANIENTWARDDTAVQRRVEDLRAAGLSPTLAAGSAAASSNPINLSAPRGENTVMQQAALGIAMKQQMADYFKSVAEIKQIQADTNLTRESVKEASERAKQAFLDTHWRTQTDALRADMLRRRYDRDMLDYDQGVLDYDRSSLAHDFDRATYDSRVSMVAGELVKQIQEIDFNGLRHRGRELDNILLSRKIDLADLDKINQEIKNYADFKRLNEIEYDIVLKEIAVQMKDYDLSTHEFFGLPSGQRMETFQKILANIISSFRRR